MLLCVPVLAQDRDIQLTIFASQVDMEGDTEFEDGFEADFEDGNALGITASRPINRWFAVEGGVFAIRSDAALNFEGAALDLGSIDLVPFTAGVQVHLLGDSRFDPYVGVGGAYIVADDLNSSDLDTLGLGRIELDNEFTYYMNVGLGIRIAGGFGIAVDARQFQYEPTSTSTATGGEEDLDLSPRLLSVGLRLRF